MDISCLLRLRHHHLFRHLANFGAVNLPEKVNALALCDPTDAISSLGFVFGLFFAFSFSYCRSVLVSRSRFEMRILDFLFVMSLGHELQAAIIIMLVAECRLLNTYSSDLTTCILYRLCNMLLVTADSTSHHFVSKA